MKRRLLLFFLLVSSFAFAQNNIYRSGGITQTVGAPTFVPGASGNIVAIDTVTGEWYVNPNRLSGSSWISAGYRLTNISGSVPPAYTPTAHQSHFVVNAANQLYYWNGSSWQSVGGGGGSTDALRLKFIVVNKSGGTLNKGDVVYVSGAQGNRVAVKKALASVDSLSANTLGVIDETVANNGEGYCVAEGLVSGINTSAFTEGAALYLSASTAGAITQTKPTAPNHLVLIGYCVKSNAGSGEISVHIQNGYELGELHDVYVPAPSNGQVLTYNTTNARWQAGTVADQSATNELQTIDTFSLSGQTLRASLLNDGVAASSVTLPIVDVVAGTNVTVTKSNGVATVSATGGGGGGTPAGSTGQIQFNNAGAFGASANLAWDNSAAYQLNIGAPSSPTGKLNVKGGGNTSSTVNLRLTNSGNTELLSVLDDGRVNLSTNFVQFSPGTAAMTLVSTSPTPLPDRGIRIYQNNNGVQGTAFSALKSRGTYASPANVSSGDIAAAFQFSAYMSGAYTLDRSLFGASVTSSSGLSQYFISGTTDGNYTPTLLVAENGNVGVGSIGGTIITSITLPSAKLQVRGSNTSSGTNAFLVQNNRSPTPDDIYKIENNGKISYLATNTAAGTTGAQTINRPSGTVNFGIGAGSLVVTNSLCTTSSIVFATVRTNDATAYIKNVVPAAGSFTINLGANATAETSVGFFIIN